MNLSTKHIIYIIIQCNQSEPLADASGRIWWLRIITDYLLFLPENQAFRTAVHILPLPSNLPKYGIQSLIKWPDTAHIYHHGHMVILRSQNKKWKLQAKREGTKKHRFDNKTYLKPKALLVKPENSPQETNHERNPWINHKLTSANVIIASEVYPCNVKGNPINNNRSSYWVIFFVNFIWSLI